MKNHLCACALALTIGWSTSAFGITNYSFLEGRTLIQVEAMAMDFGLPSALYQPITGVDAYRVEYTMPFLGDSIVVTGALFEPTDLDPGCPHPVHVYNHGTIFARTDAPSYMSYEGQLGFLMAGLGFTVLMPDYVGLGDDVFHLHPYVHAASEAHAGAYLIDAIFTEANPSGNLHDANQIFISGYSQGGHAAMALHRELQANWPQYPVLASAPGSGPYDITGVQFPETFANESYSNPAYLAYTALAWQSVYGNLFDDPSEYFQEPYASQLYDLFDGINTGGQINAALPYYTADLVQPGVLDLLLIEGEPFQVAATDNDVYDWVPTAPLRMYYCTQDEQVFYQNALSAAEHMQAAGATAVEAINLGAYDHSGCAGQAIFGATLWFLSQSTVCGPNNIAEMDLPQVSAFPNPTRGAESLSLSASVEWRLLDASGREVRVGFGAAIPLNGIANGMYYVHMSDRAALPVVVTD